MVEFNSKFQDIQDILRLKWIPEILASIDSGKNSFSVILINIPYISETELNRKIKALLTRHLIQKNEKGLYEFDLHPFSWTDIIKLLFGNEFGILPDSFLLI